MCLSTLGEATWVFWGAKKRGTKPVVGNEETQFTHITWLTFGFIESMGFSKTNEHSWGAHLVHVCASQTWYIPFCSY